MRQNPKNTAKSEGLERYLCRPGIYRTCCTVLGSICQRNDRRHHTRHEKRTSDPATVESLAYQVTDVIEAMEKEAGLSLASLKVDGGACANDFLMQFQADLLNAKVERPKCIETTALGAAYLAGIGVGYWKNSEEIRKNWALEHTFLPKQEENWRKEVRKGWKKAVSCAGGWARDQHPSKDL